METREQHLQVVADACRKYLHAQTRLCDPELAFARHGPDMEAYYRHWGEQSVLALEEMKEALNSLDCWDTDEHPPLPAVLARTTDRTVTINPEDPKSTVIGSLDLSPLEAPAPGTPP